MGNHPQMVRFPLEERCQQLAVEIQKAHPEMGHAEVLSRARTALELDSRTRGAALMRPPSQNGAPHSNHRNPAPSDDPAQSGIVKRAERMAAEDAARKTVETARHSENLARAQSFPGQAS